MRRTALRCGALTVLVAVAGALGYTSYASVSPRPHAVDAWERAITIAHRADRTKAVVPALRIRDEAIAAFDELGRAGSPQARSRAAMLAGLLQVRNAAAQSDPKSGLTLAASELQRAVRLDRANDDAAYDLELLLSKAIQVGHPISPGELSKARKSLRAGMSRVGTGY